MATIDYSSIFANAAAGGKGQATDYDSIFANAANYKAPSASKRTDPFAPPPWSLAYKPEGYDYKTSGTPEKKMLPGSVFTGGGSYGGGASGFQSTSSPTNRPVEMYLGAAPSASNLDLSSPISNFRSIFNQINSGVNPNFNVDQQKLAGDAKAAAASLNMSPAQIKAMIAGINPTTGEVIADTKQISDALNNPAEIAAKANAVAGSLNKKYQDQFESAMPGYKINMQAANDLTSAYLTANIPRDVVDEVFRNSAAKGFTTGLFGGGIGRNMAARDLGLTSLQLQTAGANLLQQTANIANSVLQSTMPVTGENLAGRFMTDPNQIFSTVSNRNRVDANTIFNAVYVPTSQIYNQMATMAQTSTMAMANFEASKMVPPAQVFDALVSQSQYNAQIATSNALNAWQSQPLPGQFDINKGQYVGFKPGSYSATRPNLPGTGVAAGAGTINMGGVNVPYSQLKGPGGRALVAQAQQAEQAQAQAYSSSAYVPQLAQYPTGRV